MNIRFEILDELKQEVLILDVAGGEVIGKIFTPSGTNKDIPNAIQVCGFDEAFSLWGCGVFCDEKGNPKKDIQLLFNKNSRMDKYHKVNLDLCGRCLGKDKCNCEDLRLKELKEIIVGKIENKNG